MTRLKTWGINTIGPGSPYIASLKEMPYIVNLAVSADVGGAFGGVTDYYGDAFLQSVRAAITREVTPRITDNLLIGYLTGACAIHTIDIAGGRLFPFSEEMPMNASE